MTLERSLDLGAGRGTSGTSLERAELTFIGTATVLLRWGDLRVLTDPNFLHAGDHVHLGFGMTSQRRTEPAIELDQLPPIDLVLLSHLHEDHFDALVQRKLDKDTPIVTTPPAARGLRRMGFRALEPLETWQRLVVTKGSARLRFTAMPGKHAPGPLRLVVPPTMGTLLELERPGPRPYRIYVTGDTLLFDQLREIPLRYPEIDLMLIHLGGTRILGVLLTMNAKMGVELVRIVAPEKTVPIHFDDYDVFRDPLENFLREVAAAGLASRVQQLARGEKLTLEIAKLAERRAA